MKKITLLLFTVLLSVATSNVFAAATLPITTGDINNAMPEGWTYISNNSDKYPDPAWYSDGGIKFNFEGMGIETPEFNAQSTVEVTITIKALNQNTKSPASQDAFTVYGLGADGATVATSTLKSVSKGDNTVTLSGNNIVKVKVIMTGYPSDGTKYCNVSLGGVSVKSTTSGVNNSPANAVKFHISNNALVAKSLDAGTQVEIFNAVGTKVLTTTYNGTPIALNNLSKGIYIVKAGKYTQKILF